ncbi:protein trunk [Dermacentor andersoni]|uniref:protein trunk n=1 Tax=Dermacentor andersoni TaxID=34620 RepID=UPI003B3B91E8
MLSLVRIGLVTAAFLQLLEPAASSRDDCTRTTVEELQERLGPAFNARYMSIDKPPKDEEPTRIYARHTESVLQSDDPYAVSSPDNAQLDQRAHPSFRVDPDFVRDVASSAGHASAHDGPQTRARRNGDIVDDGESHGTPKKRRKSSFRLRKTSPWKSLRERDETSAAPRRRGGIQRGNSHRGRRHDGVKKPWGCESRMEWLDLGEDRFPRYLRTVRCMGEACWFTHFQCKGRAFTVNVLKRVAAQPACGGEGRTSPENLPGDLREKWVFEERAVTFCCDCTATSED